MKRLPICLLACFLSLGLCSILPAQEAEPSTPDEAAKAETESPEEARKRAREARIAEYLRKKEERRATRDESRKAQEAEGNGDETNGDESFVPPPRRKKSKKANRAHLNSDLPRPLAEAQASVRASKLGQDPTVRAYLDMVDSQAASAQQLGALGNFLAQGGMPWDALEYYLVAVNLDESDAVLWVNLGTLHRQLGKAGAAIKAYQTAVSIDPNNATAHYNLGAAYDLQNKYEGAIVEYKAALTIDPSLGDPAVNPQAANNPRLMAVRLLLYQEQVGSLGLPMEDVPGGELASEDAATHEENGHPADR